MSMPNRKTFSHFLGWLALATLLSCSESKEIPQRLINTYATVVVTRNSIADTAEAQRQVRKILADSGYSTEGFEAELRTYAADPAKFRALYDSTSRRINAMSGGQPK
ncbi:MAG: hypothetical protein MUC47_01360 [Candidatus Kapabacteria bacterium]|nr:hypothetical protein [Candidatus Kapabacteria bacterium]